jgi:glycine/D-amino acid oxidase-like deaminating enzyme/nitrite reductase/ring-hydroxylating ferredoxin subunit
MGSGESGESGTANACHLVCAASFGTPPALDFLLGEDRAMTHSPWTADFGPFPSLTTDLQVDAVVVGGGLTGLTTAYLLKQAGKTVALLERDSCGMGDTGCTTAHLTAVTDIRPRQLLDTFGQDHAQAVWDAGQAAIEQIRANITALGIDCGFQLLPGYLHQASNSDGDQSDALRDDSQAVDELGFDAQFVDAVPLANRPGVRFGNQALFHPLRYLAGLAGRIPGDGSHLFEHTEVESVADDPLVVKAGEHRIRCGHVIVATHVPVMGKTNLLSAMVLQSKLAPYTSYAIAARLPRGSAPHALWWDTNDPYNYLRIGRGMEAQSDLAILGGQDHKTGQDDYTPVHFHELKSLLLSMLPRAEVTHQWSGQVVETNDGLPYIGETAPRQFVATGFGGNGMTFGTLAAMLARDYVLEIQNPWSRLFHPGRTKVLGGAWDYLKENIDYPYYMVKDRLKAAEGKTPQSVGSGQGKILRIDGQRVAVSRDDEGQTTCLSAVCPHMGCIVHWNDAENSWDCPCHGSRFAATGEVIAGPAESPLEKVETGAASAT